jgi:hypothetical protein
MELVRSSRWVGISIVRWNHFFSKYTELWMACSSSMADDSESDQDIGSAQLVKTEAQDDV